MLLMPGDLMYGADTEVDGGQRVNIGRVTFPVARTQDRIQYWIPQFYDNAFFFYGQRADLVTEFITAWCNLSYSRSKDSSLFLLDRDNLFKQGFADSKVESKKLVQDGIVTYRSNTEHIADTLKSIEDICYHIHNEINSRKLSVATNRRTLIIFIALNNVDTKIIHDYLPMVKNLMHSSAERVYPVFVASHSDALPIDMVRESHFGVFIGESNETHCLNMVFPDDEYRVSEKNTLEEVGLLQVKTLSTLEPISPLGKTFSQWHHQYTRHQDEAHDEYAELLARLDDGSTVRK